MSGARGTKSSISCQITAKPLGPLEGALRRYQRIVGVDTNTISDDGLTISVTIVCELKDIVLEGPRWDAHVDPLWGLEFHDPVGDSERLGWRHVLARGEEENWAGEGEVLLVVDSHLDQVHQMNSRAEQVLDEYYLPTGWSLRPTRQQMSLWTRLRMASCVAAIRRGPWFS